MLVARPADPSVRAVAVGAALTVLLAGCATAGPAPAADPPAAATSALPLEHVHGAAFVMAARTAERADKTVTGACWQSSYEVTNPRPVSASAPRSDRTDRSA